VRATLAQTLLTRALGSSRPTPSPVKEPVVVQKITPFLWFDDNAEEAARFYASVFKNSRIGEIRRYGEAGPGPAGSVMTVSFELEGQEFIALNGGPHFTFTEAVSFFVKCETQDEVDALWTRLTDGGQESQCGWLKDKYGLSWQIIPNALMEMLGDKDPEKAGRVMAAMLKMRKIDVKALEAAYRGE
jgi:predicted 3-demethylubiquinone-9 3-methyltransferase (glyoxalase superfamily)